MFRYWLFCFFIFLGLVSRGQQAEFGPLAGGAIYYGDVTPDRLLKNFSLVRPSAGVYWQYHFNDYLSLRANFIVAELEGHDKYSTSRYKNERNLSFMNTLYEGSVFFEYNWFGANFEGDRVFSPYAFIGAGAFKHNPRTYYQGQLYYLQPLGTEGQGLEGYAKPYSLMQFVIPVGGGFKIIINETFNVSIEFGGRVTFTDYIDDISSRYPDLGDLQRERGSLAVALSYRTPEITGEGPFETRQGVRGNSWRDYYYVGSVKVGINLSNLNNEKGRKCYSF